MEVQAGYEFVDPGVKATDNLDGDLGRPVDQRRAR